MSERMQQLREAARMPETDLARVEDYYSAPSRVELFARCLPEAEVLFHESVGSYQGTEYALFRFRGALFLWRDGFGSCSGCDSLCAARSAQQALDYFQGTLCEGNTREVGSVAEAVRYLRETDDYHWDRAEVAGLADQLEALRLL